MTGNLPGELKLSLSGFVVFRLMWRTDFTSIQLRLAPVHDQSFTFLSSWSICCTSAAPCSPRSDGRGWTVASRPAAQAASFTQIIIFAEESCLLISRSSSCSVQSRFCFSLKKLKQVFHVTKLHQLDLQVGLLWFDVSVAGFHFLQNLSNCHDLQFIPRSSSSGRSGPLIQRDLLIQMDHFLLLKLLFPGIDRPSVFGSTSTFKVLTASVSTVLHVSVHLRETFSFSAAGLTLKSVTDLWLLEILFQITNPEWSGAAGRRPALIQRFWISSHDDHLMINKRLLEFDQSIRY